eukprot:scaffold76899_cov84-Phaeocystis_antarctica.AAC.2
MHGKCTAYAWHAWHMHGICTIHAHAWHMHGICMVYAWHAWHMHGTAYAAKARPHVAASPAAEAAARLTRNRGAGRDRGRRGEAARARWRRGGMRRGAARGRGGAAAAWRRGR